MDQAEKDSRQAMEKWKQAAAVAELPDMAFPMSQQQAESFGAFDEDAITEEEVKAAQFDNDIEASNDVDGER